MLVRAISDLFGLYCGCGSRGYICSIINIEKAITKMHHTLITDEELMDYHYHQPTNTISIFTDGSCTATSATGSFFTRMRLSAQQVTTTCILSLINNIYKEYNKKVVLQHIYNHVKEKKTKAVKAGDAAVAALNNKLEVLQYQLHSNLDTWIDSNKVADKLANKVHGGPPLFDKWTLYDRANPVTLFDGDGREVNGDVRG